MTATSVIEEIEQMPPEEQSRVIQFAIELARKRQLSGKELTLLAQRMVESDDPAEVEKLKSALTRGFYGD
jgi:isocitrate/isopropylmalate dehydrogenase